MGRYSSPSLFIAVNGFDRNAQQFSQLFLRFVQGLACLKEFLAIHRVLQIISNDCRHGSATPAKYSFT